MKKFGSGMFLVTKDKIIDFGAKEMQNLKWLEVDDGVVISMKFIEAFFCDEECGDYKVSFMTNRDAYSKTFDNETDRNAFFEDIKVKLGALVS